MALKIIKKIFNQFHKPKKVSTKDCSTSKHYEAVLLKLKKDEHICLIDYNRDKLSHAMTKLKKSGKGVFKSITVNGYVEVIRTK